MKQIWKHPQLVSLNMTQTKQDADSLAINPDHQGRVYCPYCGRTFESTVAYEGHKVADGTLGTECPSAPKGDGILQAEMRVVS